MKSFLNLAIAATIGMLLATSPAAWAQCTGAPTTLASGAVNIAINNPGCYVATGPITPAVGVPINVNVGNVYIDLAGHLIGAPPGSPSISLNTLSNVEVRNGSLAGGNAGILNTVSTQHVEIEDVFFSGIFGPAINLQDVGAVVIRGNRFIENQRGVAVNPGAVYTVSTGTISGNEFRDSGGIHVNSASGMTFERNDMDLAPAISLASDGIACSGCQSVRIAHNNIVSAQINGIFVGGGSRGCQVEGNTISKSSFDGIIFSFVDNSIVRGNVSQGNGSSGITIGGNANTLVANQTNLNGEAGIWLTGIGGRTILRANDGTNNAAIPAASAGCPFTAACGVPDLCDDSGSTSSLGNNLLPPGIPPC